MKSAKPNYYGITKKKLYLWHYYAITQKMVFVVSLKNGICGARTTFLTVVLLVEVTWLLNMPSEDK